MITSAPQPSPSPLSIFGSSTLSTRLCTWLYVHLFVFPCCGLAHSLFVVHAQPFRFGSHGLSTCSLGGLGANCRVRPRYQLLHGPHGPVGAGVVSRGPLQGSDKERSCRSWLLVHCWTVVCGAVQWEVCVRKSWPRAELSRLRLRWLLVETETPPSTSFFELGDVCAG